MILSAIENLRREGGFRAKATDTRVSRLEAEMHELTPIVRETGWRLERVEQSVDDLRSKTSAVEKQARETEISVLKQISSTQWWAISIAVAAVITKFLAPALVGGL